MSEEFTKTMDIDPNKPPSPNLGMHQPILCGSSNSKDGTSSNTDGSHDSLGNNSNEQTNPEPSVESPGTKQYYYEQRNPELAVALPQKIVPANVDAALQPLMGMQFSSQEEAYQFYLLYAQKCGFPIVKRNCKKKNDVYISSTYTCQRGSRPKREAKFGDPSKKRAVLYTGCPAKLIVKYKPEKEMWVISAFEEAHNHSLCPEHVRFMRSHQVLPLAVQKQIDINNEASSQQNCMFTEEAMCNFFKMARRLKLGEGDAAALIAFFDRKQKESPDFFYSLQFDDDGILLNVFWADSRARAACKEFGNVVSFDSTYLTNKYDIPLAMFLTGNQHKQNVLLASVLLGDDKEPNYWWAFQKYKDCMGESVPEAIITDQCPSICKAVKNVFPNARHRLCLWHVMKKLPSQLGPKAIAENASVAIANAVYDSHTIEMFEEVWKEIIKSHNLNSSDWLDEMYEKRAMWVPAYVKGSFWAGMSTTQRSESINSFFDGYVNSKTPLKVFVSKFDEAMKEKYEKESYEDYCSLAKDLPLVTATPYELQCREFYTRTIQKEFRDQCVILANCSVQQMNEDEEIYNMVVKQLATYLAYKVTVKKKGHDVTCECRLFQFKGFLCAHALSAYRQINIFEIPEKYIIRRWRKDCRRSYKYIALSTGPIPRDINNYNRILRECYNTVLELVEVASCNKDAEKELVEGMNKLLNQISGGPNTKHISHSGSNEHVSNKTKRCKRPQNVTNNSSQNNMQMGLTNSSVQGPYIPNSPLETARYFLYTNSHTPVNPNLVWNPSVEVQNGQTSYFSPQQNGDRQ